MTLEKHDYSCQDNKKLLLLRDLYAIARVLSTKITEIYLKYTFSINIHLLSISRIRTFC